MATPYSTVTDRFLNKITDYDLVRLTEAELEEVLLEYMFSACAQFNTSSSIRIDIIIISAWINPIQ